MDPGSSAATDSGIDSLCPECLKLDLKRAFHLGIVQEHIRDLPVFKPGSSCPLCRALQWMVDETLRRPKASQYGYDKAHIESWSGPISKTLRSIAVRLVKGSQYEEHMHLKSSHVLIRMAPPLLSTFSRGMDFDPKIALRWLSACDMYHGCVDRTVHTSLDFDFRVVDVDEYRVLNPPKGSTYAALSYVWGSIQQPVLTNNNAELFSTKRGLPENLPRTIQDAMTICRLLSLRYLWVDSLCIVQDSISHGNDQIAHMHDIYRNAYITLVIASGPDSAAGIPSLQPWSQIRNAFPFEDMWIGTSLRHISYLSGLVTNSVWNSRGWTMQEYTLSCRTLTFTSTEYFLRCGRNTFIETATDLHPQDAQEGNWVDIPRFYGGELFLSEFVSALDKYLERKLSYPSDILRAFQGMSNALVPYTGKMWWGLPLAKHNLSLCWTRYGAMTRRDGFPSWSWAGWETEVNHDKHHNPFNIPKWPVYIQRTNSPYIRTCWVNQWRRWFPHLKLGECKKSTVAPFLNVLEEKQSSLEVHYDRQHPRVEDVVFTECKPLTHDDSRLDLDCVLSFLSYAITKIYTNPVRSRSNTAGPRSISYIRDLPMVDGMSGDIPSNHQQDYENLHLASDFASGQISYILMELVPNNVSEIELRSVAVLIPVEIELSRKRHGNEPDEIVARRIGNPVRMQEETFFSRARRCIVHLW